VKVREVIITRPFWLAFEAQAGYFESVRHQYPDAGRRLERLADDLIDRVIPLLERSADIGRLYGLSQRAARTANLELSTLEQGLNLANATLREYVDAQFNILYAVTTSQVFLINLRNQKQAGY
jgi:hypothetical protein